MSREWTPPASFDSFAIDRPLGQGGMGHVYVGRDTKLDRPVALKFIAAALPTDEIRQRFLLEARAIAKLAHPNVVSVFRIGEVDDRPYIAYELVAGRTLAQLQRPLPWQTVLRIGTRLARGLAAVHAAGIVHRDIKPSNVILSDRGEVKLLDFGIAKVDGTAEPVSADEPPPVPLGSASTSPGRLTRPGALVGTPAYFAPEMWTGEGATARSDVHAFGLVMWELLTGSLPFAPLVDEALARAVVEQDVPSLRAKRADVPHSFADVIERCLRRHPAARYASAIDLRAALEGIYTVFLPRTANVEEVYIEDEAHLVAASYARILSQAPAFTQAVYDKLFELEPSIRHLFPDDLEEQKTKLAHALRIVTDGLRDPDRLVTFLEDLGRRHVAYGVRSEHLDALGRALHGTVREFDARAWTPDLSGAWMRAYGFLAQAMRRGLDSGAETTATGDVGAAFPPKPPPATPPVSSTPPRTRWVSNGGVSLAYQIMGDAPVDLLVVPPWLSHLELAHAHPAMRDFFRALTRRHRVIAFDRRGTGLSDRVSEKTTFSTHLEDMRAIMDAAASSRAVVLGIGEGARLAALFAAVHPERVKSLVLWAGRPDVVDVEAQCEKIRSEWGEPLFAETHAPSLANDATFREWLGSYQRMSASPGSAVANLRALASLDIRRVLSCIEVPTVVLQRKDDAVVPAEVGRQMASQIPGALFVSLDGADHVPFAGDTARVLRVIESASDARATIDERRPVIPAAAIVALAGARTETLPSTSARLVGMADGMMVLACSSLDDAVALARGALAKGAASRAGVHFATCPMRTPSMIARGVVEARELVWAASPGQIAFSDTVRDLGYGVELSSSMP